MPVANNSYLNGIKIIILIANEALYIMTSFQPGIFFQIIIILVIFLSNSDNVF